MTSHTILLITATFAVYAVGDFLPMQLIYAGKTKRCLPKFDFPRSFNVNLLKITDQTNMEKSVEHFEKIIFPFFQKTKEEYNYPKEQMPLVIMDICKGQDNNVLKELCEKKTFVKGRLLHASLQICFSQWISRSAKLRNLLFPKSATHGWLKKCQTNYNMIYPHVMLKSISS